VTDLLEGKVAISAKEKAPLVFAAT